AHEEYRRQLFENPPTTIGMVGLWAMRQVRRPVCIFFCAHGQIGHDCADESVNVASMKHTADAEVGSFRISNDYCMLSVAIDPRHDYRQRIVLRHDLAVFPSCGLPEVDSGDTRGRLRRKYNLLTGIERDAREGDLDFRRVAQGRC